MTPIEWTRALDPSVSHAAQMQTVATEVRKHLGAAFDKDIDGALATVELVDGLWPPNAVRGSEMAVARQRLYRVLRSLATHQLADCCERDEPVVKFGKERRPWLWVKPGTGQGAVQPAVHACPHCGGKLP